jgi:hypothetical protein
MPVKTSAAVAPGAAKRLKFLDVKWFSLSVSNTADVFRRCGHDGIVPLAHTDNHREHLKLIWSFSEVADRMLGQSYVSS